MYLTGGVEGGRKIRMLSREKWEKFYHLKRDCRSERVSVELCCVIFDATQTWSVLHTTHRYQKWQNSSFRVSAVEPWGESHDSVLAVCSFAFSFCIYFDCWLSDFKKSVFGWWREKCCTGSCSQKVRKEETLKQARCAQFLPTRMHVSHGDILIVDWHKIKHN